MGVLWNVYSAPDMPGVQSSGRTVLWRGPRVMAPRGSGSAPPTFLVCPVESRESAVLCPLITTLHSKDGAPEGSSQQQGL